MTTRRGWWAIGPGLGLGAVLVGLPACVPDELTPASSSAAAATSSGDHWQPTGTMPWHIQYQGDMEDPGVAVHNLDGVGTDPEQVEALHAAGSRVICYFNAGGSETFRDDYASFPSPVGSAPRPSAGPAAWLQSKSATTTAMPGTVVTLGWSANQHRPQPQSTFDSARKGLQLRQL